MTDQPKDLIPPEPKEIEPLNEDELNERLRHVYDEAKAKGELPEDD